jgi:hypothetical protein
MDGQARGIPASALGTELPADVTGPRQLLQNTLPLLAPGSLHGRSDVCTLT